MFSVLKSALAHLPVNSLMSDVGDAFASGMVPVVTSEVASGKTLLLPISCAERVEGLIYVLEPTRFLSNNAAESMRMILGKGGEDLVGCLNSNRSDDESLKHRDNRIVFTTVGYALSSGIVTSAENIIFDEAHETSIDLSLAKAIVHKRRERGELVKTAIFSATIDEQNEIEFWGEDHTIHFTTAGSAFPTEVLHRPAWSLGESVVNLIQDHHRKGILVFVEGKEEINDAVANIQAALIKNGYQPEDGPEIHTVHGNSNGEERKLASRTPTADIKILIGTNVLESGVSLPWVDAGISNGKTKVMHVNGNNHRLVREELPAWRIKQQTGRVSRFKPGVFILADVKATELRPNLAEPDIVRLPLTELVMHCAKLPDVNLRELTFSPAEQPRPEAIREAVDTLVEYGLVTETEDGHLHLTDDGKLVETLPLSYQASAAFCEAHRLNAVATMLPLIATIDVGDIRHDMRLEMYGGNCTNSDVIYQVTAVAAMVYGKSQNQGTLKELAEANNISLRKYREYDNLLTALEEKLRIRANYSPYMVMNSNPSLRRELEDTAKQIIFRGMSRNRYLIGGFRGDVSTSPIGARVRSYGNAVLTKTTRASKFDNHGVKFVTGTLRTITPKMSMPFTVVENVTMFTELDLKFLIERFGRKFVDPNAELIRPESIYTADDEYYMRAPRTFRSAQTDYTPSEPVSKEPKIGGFGDLLQAALGKK